MSAVKEYRKALRIADEILSEGFAMNLRTASTSRELADAALAELEAELAVLKAENTRMDDFCNRTLVERTEQTEAELAELKTQLQMAYENADFDDFDEPLTFEEYCTDLQEQAVARAEWEARP